MILIRKAENFVFQLFKDKLSSEYTYHNFTHVQRVVSAVKVLAEAENISENDREILELAAWFHDIGYIECIENHEDKSAGIVRLFLEENDVDETLIRQVEALILSTKNCGEPENKLEEIMRDADSSHFGDENYIGISELLRAEWKITLNKEYTDLEWNATNRNLLLNCHRYYTSYAKENWQPVKERNISALQKNIRKLETGGSVKKEKTEKPDRPDRGIDTMFRVTLKNHIQLSEIADSKANILLSVNAILISIVLSVLIPKLDSPKNYHLILPTFVLLMSSVFTIVFAILSTRPKVTTGTFIKEEIVKKKINILFFGNFHKLKLTDFEWAMNNIMKDRETIYNSLTWDLYYLGLVLNRKYKLLRITYNIFMVGIVVSVITFVLAFVYADFINLPNATKE